MVTIEIVGLALTVLLGIMPLYLMLARIHRDIGRLSADHSSLDDKVQGLVERADTVDRKNPDLSRPADD